MPRAVQVFRQVGVEHLAGVNDVIAGRVAGLRLLLGYLFVTLSVIRVDKLLFHFSCQGSLK